MNHPFAVPDVTGTTLAMLFDYDPGTGHFTHKTGRGPRGGGAGCIAGHRMNHGYIAIGIPGKTVLAHRLAWLWMTGEWPKLEIDHINRNRSDNRWSNLREATRPQQSANGSIRTTNTSGVIGVFWDTSRKRWSASLMVNYKTIRLGRFKKFEDAVAARKNAEEKYFGEFSPTISAAA